MSTSPSHPITTIDPRQLPPEPVVSPTVQITWGEIPQPGAAPNTWTLTKPITNGIAMFWDGVRQTVGGDFLFSGNGSGGTLLTLTTAGIAAGIWSTGELVADYQ